ncbi:hypothetical protein [Thermus parvatiensis]|uniref:hypothetical protein n=1 Tax=Thermus parvatiensis TaxID=456163 RepID=UPI000AD7EE3E|nr:hypothetical protein [Thermus parvatiensis]
MSGVTINFPVIADLDMKVSHLYGLAARGARHRQAPATLAELKADEAKKGEYTEYRRWYLRLKKAD